MILSAHSTWYWRSANHSESHGLSKQQYDRADGSPSHQYIHWKNLLQFSIIFAGYGNSQLNSCDCGCDRPGDVLSTDMKKFLKKSRFYSVVTRLCGCSGIAIFGTPRKLKTSSHETQFNTRVEECEPWYFSTPYVLTR